MSDTAYRATRPEDRVPVWHMLVYGSGAFANNLLAGTITGMMIVLNLELGMDPALVGVLGMAPRLFDAFTDPIIGYISDKTKSRWGRRRPFIFVGSILVGLIFIALWQLPAEASQAFYFWYFLFGSFAFYLAYTIFVTPWVALGYELTPDYHERTRLMGVQNFVGQLAYFVPPWLIWIMKNENWFDNMREGAAGLAFILAGLVIFFGILPAIFLRERSAIPGAANDDFELEADRESLRDRLADFARGFATTMSFPPFLKLCAASFLIFNGFMLIAAFQNYVLIYYVAGGDIAQGGLYAGYVGTFGFFANFAVIAFVAWLGTRLGKRRALSIGIAASMIGYAAKWFCYNPEYPMLALIPAPLIAFGFGSLFTIMPAMMADIVDLDELNTGERREGMYGSIYWWVLKLGLSAALLGSGLLLNATGFDVKLEADQSANTLLLMRLFDIGVPFVASGLAIFFIASSGITQERAREVRAELETRRGHATLAPV